MFITVVCTLFACFRKMFCLLLLSECVVVVVVVVVVLQSLFCGG